MRFIFICPEKYQVFESGDFKIIENRGVKVDQTGKKFLDAKVELVPSCPFCEKKHVFHASELMCPFIPNE